MAGKQTGIAKWLLPSAIIVAAVIISFMFLDKPIADYIKNHKYPAKLPLTIKQAVYFFDSYEQIVPLILLISAAAISAGQQKWKMIGQLILAMIISAIPIWIGKSLIARQRPRWSHATNWYDTFTGFLPGLGNFKFQSMPSGDAALDFAITVILAQFFPKHRVIFYILAIGGSLSRVMLNYHYLSDVIVGATIGYLAGKLVLYIATPARS